MNEDIIHFTILEDGTVKIVTDGVSGANHVSADELLDGIEAKLGGTTDHRQRTDRKSTKNGLHSGVTVQGQA